MRAIIFRRIALVTILVTSAFMIANCGQNKPKRGKERQRSESDVRSGVCSPGHVYCSGAIWTSIISFTRAVIVDRYMSPVCPRCATFPPFQSLRLIQQQATGLTMSQKICWAVTHGATVTILHFQRPNGEYDGRWMFINDNANGRVARIDLRDFKTKQLLKIPNISGNHGATLCHGEHRVYHLRNPNVYTPFPQGAYADVTDYATKYKGVLVEDKSRTTIRRPFGWLGNTSASF